MTAKSTVSIIEEYFSTGDVDTAASDLRDLGSDKYHYYFVNKLISCAMDRHDKERERWHQFCFLLFMPM